MRIIKIFTLILVFCAQAARLFNLTGQYAVNVLFWDQWDFYNPIFEDSGWSQYFIQQHGPIRQGLGLFFTAAMNSMTGWNTRLESFGIYFILILACIAAVMLKFRLARTVSFFDSIIIFLCLATSQIETIVGTPNPAHSALPLLLILLYCHAWLVKNAYLRYGLILILNHFLVFTGFGIFMGVVTISLLVIELGQAWRMQNWKRLSLQAFLIYLALMSFLLFEQGYVFASAADCFGFRWTHLLKYPFFSGLLFARTISLTYFPGSKMGYLALFAGICLLLIFVSLFAHQLKQLIVQTKDIADVDRCTFILIYFALLYALNISVGRLCLSLQASQSSRYVTLIITGFIALYLWISCCLKGRLRNGLLLSYLVVVVLGVFLSSKPDHDTGEFFRIRKQTWKDCYLQYEDVTKCDAMTEFQIYPDPERTSLGKKLAYLRERKLNLFLDAMPSKK